MTNVTFVNSGSLSLSLFLLTETNDWQRQKFWKLMFKIFDLKSATDSDFY